MTKRERNAIRKFFVDYVIVSMQIKFRSQRLDELFEERKRLDEELDNLHERKEQLIEDFDALIFELATQGITFDAEKYSRLCSAKD